MNFNDRSFVPFIYTRIMFETTRLMNFWKLLCIFYNNNRWIKKTIARSFLEWKSSIAKGVAMIERK